MNIIHVTVEKPTEKEFDTIKHYLETNLDDLPNDVEIVVSDERMSIVEMPHIDDYIDELAEAMVDKMEERELGR